MILGLIFAVTACAYGVMTVKMSTAQGISDSAGTAILEFMSEHGLLVLSIELALLAIVTAAAIGTDSYWSSKEPQEPPHDADR
jgi:hypothetical protein